MITMTEWVAQQTVGRTVRNASVGAVTTTVNRVPTMRGVQHHRGFKGYVLVTFEGERKPETFYCCPFHQRRRAAREHAARLSRAFRRHMSD